MVLSRLVKGIDGNTFSAAGGTVRIGGFVDASTVDWYGNVTLMIFAAGCNFRCPYCQNSSLIPLDSGSEIQVDAIEDRIRTNRLLLDALGVSGGEPTLQPEELEVVYRLARSCGLKTFLNTNGSRPKVIESLISKRLVDQIALDVKAPLRPEKHCRVIGLNDCARSVKGVESSLELCSKGNVFLETRTTVVPGLSDEEDFIREIARSLRGKTGMHVLQQFNPQAEILDPGLKKRGFTTRESLLALALFALEEGLERVFIKTREEGLERVK